MQGDDTNFSDIHMLLLILRVEQEATYPGMGALMHYLDVLDHAERHNVVGHDGIHYPEVGLLGAINIRDKIPDFGVQVAGRSVFTFLGLA